MNKIPRIIQIVHHVNKRVREFNQDKKFRHLPYQFSRLGSP